MSTLPPHIYQLHLLLFFQILLKITIILILTPHLLCVKHPLFTFYAFESSISRSAYSMCFCHLHIADEETQTHWDLWLDRLTSVEGSKNSNPDPLRACTLSMCDPGQMLQRILVIQCCYYDHTTCQLRHWSMNSSIVTRTLNSWPPDERPASFSLLCKSVKNFFLE